MSHNTKLMEAVEATFSKENLEKDKYLVGKMDNKQYVPLSVISKFPKIENHLPKGVQVTDALEAACEESELLQFEVRDGIPCVRRKPQEAQRGNIDPRVWAQQFWMELTTPINEPDETTYSVEDLTKLEQFSAQQDSFVSTYGYFEEDARNGFCGVLSTAEIRMREEEPKAAAWESSAAKARRETTESDTWADKSAQRRNVMQNLKGRGGGYNKTMIPVEMCRGPDGSGFHIGRGKPVR
eukprot:TRINITY_DN10221_c0_g1_i1.p1 TRINITY_DN10221_c0_g1~~TRINITY_DN10221_c0_g1_i1.p1  ORF type:complete len:239 (+),score=51.27 TRINITY_DN10221_c0_g1_i1:271-987(+)